ncbi:hypothetical protein [Holospora obtusa]|uniref:hypothetical protein n=1 Tax=Holospora obtusa TaxID=49893 RepID=UPI0012EC5A1D|nr:hypothetical protein [Holospora obtusa]
MIKKSILTSDIAEKVKKSVEKIDASDKEAITALRQTVSPFLWWRNAYVVKYQDNLKAANTEIDKYIKNIKKLTESVAIPAEQKETFLKGVYYVRNGFNEYDQKFNPYLHLAMLDTSIARAQERKSKQMIAQEINEFSLSFNSMAKSPPKLFNKYTLCINDEFNKAYPKILEMDTSIDEKGKKSFQITRNASMEKLVDDVYTMQSCSFELAIKQYEELFSMFNNLLGRKIKTLQKFLEEIKEIKDKSKTISASDLTDPENPYFRIVEFYKNAVSAGGKQSVSCTRALWTFENAFKKGRCMDGLEIDANYTIAQLEGLQLALPTLHMECPETTK